MLCENNKKIKIIECDLTIIKIMQKYIISYGKNENRENNIIRYNNYKNHKNIKIKH